MTLFALRASPPFALLVATITAIGAALGAGASTAHADQAFVCEDGGVVTVAYRDLERIKRINPCVARYFGLEREAAAYVAGKSDVRAQPIPLPGRKPHIARPDLRTAGNTAPSTTGSVLTAKSAEVAVPLPAYRRVRIINAKPGASIWFDHRR